MSTYLSYDEPLVSYYDIMYGHRHNRLQYWDAFELQAALNAALSELGLVLAQPDSPDRVLAVCLVENWIAQLGTELRRRQRATNRLGQDFRAAHREARRYPPEVIRDIKAVYDLRDMVAREIGLTKPIAGTICS